MQKEKPFRRLREYSKKDLLDMVFESLSENYYQRDELFPRDMNARLKNNFCWAFHGGMFFHWKSIDRCFDKFWTPEKKVIFMYSYEGHSMFEKVKRSPNDSINCLHKYYQEKNYSKEQYESTYFLNGDNNLKQRYDEWFSGKDYPYKFNVVPWNFWYSATKNDIVYNFSDGRPDYDWAPKDYERFQAIGREQFEFESLSTRKPSKDFLSLNGISKQNRDLFYDSFKDMNCYLSYLHKNISLDGMGINYTSAPSVDRLNKFHHDSYFSVVSEGGNENNTFYNDSLHNIKTHNLFITEKTWRPIHTGHPFIISGNPGTLKILREWGFETFPEIFDESYDEYHGKQRDKFIVSEVERVCKLDSKQKHDLFKSVEEKVIHNQNHFFENDRPIEECIKQL